MPACHGERPQVPCLPKAGWWGSGVAGLQGCGPVWPDTELRVLRASQALGPAARSLSEHATDTLNAGVAGQGCQDAGTTLLPEASHAARAG